MLSAGFMEHVESLPRRKHCKINCIRCVTYLQIRSMPPHFSQRANQITNEWVDVRLIICQELTLIELSFSLIKHDPFLPQPPLPVCTYSTSIHVYTDCKIRGIYISISHKPLTVIHIDANTKRHTHWCRNTSKRTNTHTQKHGHSTGDVHLQTQPPA